MMNSTVGLTALPPAATAATPIPAVERISPGLLLGVIGLAILSTVTCFYGLHQGPRLGDHECINALGARQIVQSGNWLIPYVGEIPRS